MFVEQQHVQRKRRYSQRWEQWSLLLGTFSASFSARNSKFGYYQNPFKKNLLKIRNIMCERWNAKCSRCWRRCSFEVFIENDLLLHFAKTLPVIDHVVRPSAFISPQCRHSVLGLASDGWEHVPEIEHVDSPRVCLLCALVSVCACFFFYVCMFVCGGMWEGGRGGDRSLQSGAPYLPKVHWM